MEKDMNKTAENRRNAAESVLNGGIEYSAFENMDRLAAIFAMQKLLNDDPESFVHLQNSSGAGRL